MGSNIRLSKSLSYILRHGAEKEGLTFQPGGFIYLDDILKLRTFRRYTPDDIKRVVATNDKQRFYLEEFEGQLRIRANQGHTLQVEHLDLKRIEDPQELPLVVHGTYSDLWITICQQGLSKMKRNHIHFAPGEPGEDGVISGIRQSCDIFIYLNVAKAMIDGLKFYRSANNVILSPGDEGGCISTAYFDRVINRRTGTVLLDNTK